MKTKTKERPILFNGPMVRAILAGKKTQTRRPLKPQPDGQPVRDAGDGKWYVDGGHWLGSAPADIGDLLWVRETTFITPLDFTDADERDPLDDKGHRRTVSYVASMDAEAQLCAYEYGVKQTPSIHMPRWAARIFLRVTDVRVQRVQDITDGDAMTEGVALNKSRVERILGARAAFGDLWSSVYGASSWERNEWAWALTFERVDLPR